MTGRRKSRLPVRLSKNLAAASDERAAGELEGARPLARLAALPFPGLLRDGPPMARLRKLRFACFCRRQRRSKDFFDKLRESPGNFRGIPETVKKPRYSVRRQSSGGARGGKARLELDSPPLEKPCKTRLFENAFCVRPKCSAGKRSQKSPLGDFFDKLGNPPETSGGFRSFFLVFTRFPGWIGRREDSIGIYRENV